MTYQVLARKWRPRTFATLVGQEHVVRALTNALEQQRLHHAYLFTGTRGVGKTTLARILAKSLNCETGITATPCGKCSSCTEIDTGRFVDLIEVDAATNTRVDEMRQLLDNAVYAPTRGRFKVYVIDEVHMLSTSSFNAMLKTLEEPPEHIKFILATTDPQKIPVTVLSRCLQFNLKNMPASAIAAHLERVLAEEKVAAEGPALQLIAHAARGSMRDALSLLDQAIAYSGGSVTEAAVRSMLGTVDTGHLFDALEAVAAREAGRALAVADAMEARSLSFDNALGELARLLHRVALAQTSGDALPEDTPDRDRVLALARSIDPEDAQLYYQIALHGRQDLPLAPDEYAGFTMTLMRMLAFAPDAAERPKPAALASAGARSTAAPRPQNAGSFDGDWPALARALNVVGAVKQLAERSELVAWNGTRFDLTVPQESRALTDKSYVERLKAALREQLGRPVEVAVTVGTVAGRTVAAIAEGERRARLDEASQQMGADPFVQELVSSFDATIESIQPVEKALRS
ncbi:MAG TPA: DNA polymerase III subunit gamma/tau [Burkholderiales bacterium]|jgi:DNA polymerase-3 subunit gamma/tau|nr:DNA polymerase III subunit gamma/tau [Burkholderiales bacterium]